LAEGAVVLLPEAALEDGSVAVVMPDIFCHTLPERVIFEDH